MYQREWRETYVESSFIISKKNNPSPEKHSTAAIRSLTSYKALLDLTERRARPRNAHFRPSTFNLGTFGARGAHSVIHRPGKTSLVTNGGGAACCVQRPVIGRVIVTPADVRPHKAVVVESFNNCNPDSIEVTQKDAHTVHSRTLCLI